MSRINSSDPLPFTQLDRAVKSKAAILASAIGVTNQHALGSLQEFWDLNGDPRDLEKLLEADKNAVVLTRSQVVMRFQIASGKEASPDLLAEIGFLEPLPDDRFRVRGMSRYFEPIRVRLARRKAGAAGGLASAKARKAKNGTAQPVRALVREVLEQPASTPEASSEAPPKHARSKPEANAEANGNLEDRGQRIESLKAAAAPIPLPPRPTDTTSAADVFFATYQRDRFEAGYATEMPPRGLGSWFSEVMLELNGDSERFAETIRAFTRDKYWRQQNLPIRGLMAQWRQFVPRRSS